MKIPISEIQELTDDEYIETAAVALWLDEREKEIIRTGVGQAIADAFKEQK